MALLGSVRRSAADIRLGFGIALLGLVSIVGLTAVTYEKALAESGRPAESGGLAPLIQVMLAGNALPALGIDGADALKLRQFYEARGYATVWTGDAIAAERAALFLAALDHAAEDGQNPGDYHRTALAALSASSSAAGAAERDLLLTDAFLHYAHDLRVGRVAPDELDDMIALPAQSFDVLAVLEAAIKDGRLAQLLADLAPPDSDYAALKEALKRYRERLAGGDLPPIPDGDEIKLDGNDQRLPALRRRLALEDPALAAASDDAQKGDLAEALRRFQTRNGLDPDGRAGRRTLAMLNTSIADRVTQIIVNMERWRWLPHSLEARYAMVNTADGSLRVVEDGRVVLASKVIVGDEKHPSPIFRALATSVTVNPPWNVPMSIARKEMLPKLRRDPSYLMKENIQLVNGPEDDLHGVKIDWRKISANSFPYVLRQVPGPKNSLGQVKIEMPNQFDVYLHDTPAKRLFARTQRNFSHGCIRVEQAVALASLALTGDPSLGVEQIKADMADGATRHLPIARPLPIYVLYWTAFAGPDGAIVFRPDVYGRDRQLAAALASHSRLSSLVALGSQKEACTADG